MKINYRMEAINVLLNEDCILARYYPLIPNKAMQVDYMARIGCFTKNECLALSDEALMQSGLPSMDMVEMFRRFLSMYDSSPQKTIEIDFVCQTSEEAAAFRELYMLPGVKATRATLYYKSGYHTLNDIATSSAEEILSRTEAAIKEERMDLRVPLLKEVKTHIAVAKAYTHYRAD